MQIDGPLCGLSPILNDVPLSGPWPHCTMMGRFSTHFRYLVHFRNLVNLPYIGRIQGQMYCKNDYFYLILRSNSCLVKKTLQCKNFSHYSTITDSSIWTFINQKQKLLVEIKLIHHCLNNFDLCVSYIDKFSIMNIT